VWTALQKIPFGKTKSYKEIGEEIGAPNGARAVGNACGKNPLLLFIPCHRVIKSDQTLGGFGLGSSIKRTLLSIESVNN
jgi:methylated-DNA-[protein]-cysteine S-methyltransferase